MLATHIISFENDKLYTLTANSSSNDSFCLKFLMTPEMCLYLLSFIFYDSSKIDNKTRLLVKQVTRVLQNCQFAFHTEIIKALQTAILNQKKERGERK